MPAPPASSHEQLILSMALMISLGLPGLVKSASVSLLTSKILLSGVGDPLFVEIPQIGRLYAPPLAMAMFLPRRRSLSNAFFLPD